GAVDRAAVLALLAAMPATVLAPERAALRLRSVGLAPLPAAEDDLVAIGENLERSLHLAQVVEAGGVGLPEDLEVGRVDEVGHGDAVHRVAVRLHRVGG